MELLKCLGNLRPHNDEPVVALLLRLNKRGEHIEVARTGVKPDLLSDQLSEFAVVGVAAAVAFPAHRLGNLSHRGLVVPKIEMRPKKLATRLRQPWRQRKECRSKFFCCRSFRFAHEQHAKSPNDP